MRWLLAQSVRRAELGDVGDEVAGFGFAYEASFLGEKHDAFIDGRRNRPGEYDAGNRLHCADGCAYSGAFEPGAFKDARMGENMLFDGARVARKKVGCAAIGLRDFVAGDDNEHDASSRAPRSFLKVLEWCARWLGAERSRIG